MQKSLKLLEFNVYDKEEENTGDEDYINIYKDNKEFLVQMFGLNEKGDTFSVIVKGFRPFFYIKVNDNWTDEIRKEFLLHLKNYMGNYYKDSLISGNFVKRKKLDGFDAERFHTFICLKFKSTGAFNKAKKLWYTDTYNKGVFESRKLNKEGYIYENMMMATGFILFADVKGAQQLCDEVYNTCEELGQPECQIIWGVLSQKFEKNITRISWDEIQISKTPYSLYVKAIASIKRVIKKLLVNFKN